MTARTRRARSRIILPTFCQLSDNTMNIPSITGRNEMETFACLAMNATLQRLVINGTITKEQKEQFITEHTAVLIQPDSVLERLRDLFFKTGETGKAYVQVVQLTKS